MYQLLSRALGAAGYVVQYACITHCAFEYVGDFVVCCGPSMEPTLSTNNILLTARVHAVRRGDIIIACSPTDPRNQVCKRVVGLPGDQVFVGSLHNSSAQLPQAVSSSSAEGSSVRGYNNFTLETENEHIMIPRGHIWIEGDNANNSADSRFYGPVPIGLVKSRAICRVWPLSDMAFLI